MIRLFLGGRRSGKTHLAAQYAKAYGGVVVTPTRQSAIDVSDKYNVTTIAAEQLGNVRVGRTFPKIILDEIGIFSDITQSLMWTSEMVMKTGDLMCTSTPYGNLRKFIEINPKFFDVISRQEFEDMISGTTVTVRDCSYFEL